MTQILMKAALCETYGAPEMVKVKTVPRPQPKSNELLIKVMASTLNSGDVRTRGLKVGGFMKVIMHLVLGISKLRKSILGVTFSGIVEEAGSSVSQYKIGDKLFGLTGFNFGAHAEYLCISENGTIATMPNNASFEEAAALPFGAHTAIHFLQTSGIAKSENPSVLVYGASGAVGAAAVQIAQFYNSDLYAVCSSRGAQLMQQLGVENIVFYDTADFTKINKKFDIIFDAVGKISKQQVKHLLKPQGKFATVGGLSVAKESTSQLELVKQLFENGKYNATIDRVYSLDNIVEAHEYVDTERKKGNVVIKIGME